MNVLDLRGPDFLKIYLTLLPVAIGAAVFLRWWLRRPGDALPPGKLPDLHPFEVAYLAGGPKAATDAVIASLVRRGSLAVDNVGRRLKASSLPPVGVTPLEQNVYNAAVQDGRVAKIRQTVQNTARTVAGRLETLGLVVDTGQAVRVRLLPALLLAVVLAVGVTKVLVGIERHRPIGFLAPLCFVTAVLAIVFAAKSTNRTRRGSHLLAVLRTHNAALRTTAARAPDSLAGTDVAMAFALFGPAIFTAGAMDDLRRTLAPPSSGGSGCGSSSGCGGGSSDGGGSCGGGGGCGGCGGGGD